MPTTFQPHGSSVKPRRVRSFARDVLKGLSRSPKTIPSKYFYDDTGSRLFQQITQLQEYYLTRSEREILQTHAAEIAEIVFTEPFRLVELGAGDGQKTSLLLDQMIARGRPFEYVPIDICRQSILELTHQLRRRWDEGTLRTGGIVADYFDGLAAINRQPGERNLVLFLGSSIGNFSPRRTRWFFRNLRKMLHEGDYALIGFDLKKDPHLLKRAYDDSEGVTRQFNFNLLDRINRELGGRFDRRRFGHRALFNARRHCMESWLVSLVDQTVRIRAVNRAFAFRAGEGIHVESSYKYDVAQIDDFATESGFTVRRHCFDAHRWFVDSLWQAGPD